MSEYRGVHLEHGPGWHTLVEPLIDFLLDNGGTVAQVKEKFGGLRFYYDRPDDQIADEPDKWRQFVERVRQAEKDSKFICEVCGKPGELDTRGWWKTLCPEHRRD